MNELPENWSHSKIGDVAASIQYGYTASSKPAGKTRFLRITDIQKGRVIWEHVPYCDIPDEEYDKYALKNDDIVFVRTGATVGKSYIIENAKYRSVFASYLIRITLKKEILPRYIKYFFNSPLYWNQIYENMAGIGQPNFNSSKLANIVFPLAPLPEQKRIVAKLDTLFAHLDQLRARLDKIPVLLKQFRQAVLTQAVTGKLTQSDYHLRPLGEFDIEIQTGPFGSALHKEDYVVGGIPVINPSHIFHGEIIPDTSVTIKKEKSNELKAWILNDGDIILGRRGEMGRSAKYKSTDGAMVCGTGSLILRKTSLIEPDFLSFYLRSSFSIQFLEENAVGSTMVNLNQRVIKSLPFPSIAIDEQREIVRKVQSLFTFADRIDAGYRSLKDEIDGLPQAILSKAFRGELTGNELKQYSKETGSLLLAAEP